MSANLQLYVLHSQPPVTALKQIMGGRLKGKTDINPQWRIEALTDMFGACGQGWHYEVTDRRIETFDSGERALFMTIHLLIHPKDGTIWYPVVGTGGSMLVAKENEGLRVNDEAEKAAITDALSVCCKLLGIASDIYRGRWDGSKYQDSGASPARPRPVSESPRDRAPAPRGAAKAMVAALPLDQVLERIRAAESPMSLQIIVNEQARGRAEADTKTIIEAAGKRKADLVAQAQAQEPDDGIPF